LNRLILSLKVIELQNQLLEFIGIVVEIFYQMLGECPWNVIEGSV